MREPKLDIVDLIRANYISPNSSLEYQGVFPDFPDVDLDFESYPYISVIDVDSKPEWVGVGSNTQLITWVGQVGIWCKKALESSEFYEIDSINYGDKKLVDYLKQKISLILQNKWKSMSSDYKNCLKISSGELLFDIDRQSFFKPIQITLTYLEQEEI